MALDRFVEWQKEIPSKKDIEKVLKNYIGEAGTVTWENDRWFVVLHGQPSFSFKGLKECDERRSVAVEERSERFFEVIVGNNSLDIVTRLADEFTSAVAQGFVEICSRFWRAKMGM